MGASVALLIFGRQAMTAYHSWRSVWQPQEGSATVVLFVHWIDVCMCVEQMFYISHHFAPPSYPLVDATDWLMCVMRWSPARQSSIPVCPSVCHISVGSRTMLHRFQSTVTTLGRMAKVGEHTDSSANKKLQRHILSQIFQC